MDVRGEQLVPDRRTILRTVLWFALAFVVLGGVVAAVGAGEVRRLVARADRRVLAGVAGVVVLELLLQSVALRRLFATVGTAVSRGRAFLLLAGTAFVNDATPAGQAGGLPVDGLLAVRAVETDYETGVATVFALQTLNNVVMIGLGLVGAGVLAAGGAVGSGLVVAAGTAAALLAGILAGGVALWRFGDAAERTVATGLTSLARGVGRLVPVLSPPSREAVGTRVGRLRRALGVLVADPQSLAAAGVVLVAGRLVRSVGLWFAFLAVGEPVSFAVVLAVLPAAMVAAAAPTPGGLGALEAATVGLLVATTGRSAAVVGAAVLLYRGVVYWLRMGVGGGAAAWLVVFARGVPGSPSGE